MSVVIGVVNQKGGVGKTTTSINIAAGLGTLGKKILLIDFDPQGNSTTGFGIKKKTLDISTYDIIMGNARPQEAIIKTRYKMSTLYLQQISFARRNSSLPMWNSETISCAR